MTSKIEEAQAKMAAEKSKREGDKDGKNERREHVERLTSLPYLEDIGNCTVRVELPGKENETALCVDPGIKWINYIGDVGKTNDLYSQAMSLVALGRGILELNATATRACADLGLKRGDKMPSPEEFIDEHYKAWKAWRPKERAVVSKNYRKYMELKEKDRESFVDEPLPDPPETKLEALLTEVLPNAYIVRIADAIQYAVLQPQYDKAADSGN